MPYEQLPITPFNPQPQNPLQQYAQVLGLKNEINQGKMQNVQLQSAGLQLEEQKRQQESQKAIMDAYTQAQGDLSKTLSIASSSGKALPGDLIKLQQGAIQQKTQNLDLLTKQGDKAIRDADLMQGAHDQLAKLPPDQRAAVYPQVLQQLTNAGVDTNGAPPQYPGDQAFNTIGIALKGHAAQLKELQDQQKIDETKRHNQAMETKPSEAMQGLNDFLKAKSDAKGSPLSAAESLAARNEYYKRNKSQTTIGMTPNPDIADAAQSIYEGKAPPVLTEYSYRDRTAVVSALRKIDPNFNLAQAEQDWKGTQKYLATLNGSQQTRLRQAIQFTDETLPQIQDAYNAWKATGLPGGFKAYNKAALSAAANLPGKAGSAAKNLQALIADFTSELGTVYKGGNSSTDESLKLAAQNLAADWNDQTFNDAIKRIERSLRIRKNSLNQGAQGISAGSPYKVPNATSNAPATAKPWDAYPSVN